jgi:hypothetical protein
MASVPLSQWAFADGFIVASRAYFKPVEKHTRPSPSSKMIGHADMRIPGVSETEEHRNLDRSDTCGTVLRQNWLNNLDSPDGLANPL